MHYLSVEENTMFWKPDEDDNETEELRDKLRDYYGTAVASGNPMAVIDLGKVDNMDDDEVREEARKNRIK